MSDRWIDAIARLMGENEIPNAVVDDRKMV
jgi:hypothetical protein